VDVGVGGCPDPADEPPHEMISRRQLMQNAFKRGPRRHRAPVLGSAEMIKRAASSRDAQATIVRSESRGILRSRLIVTRPVDAALIVSVVERGSLSAAGVNGAGLKLQAEVAGRPEQLNVMLPA
jgi:hypothetical protein